MTPTKAEELSDWLFAFASGKAESIMLCRAAAELRRLSAVEAERDALRAALTRVLDTHEREAKAYLTAQVASENFSRRSAKADEHAHLQAAVEASKAEKEARELLAAMKGTT